MSIISKNFLLIAGLVAVAGLAGCATEKPDSNISLGEYSLTSYVPLPPQVVNGKPYETRKGFANGTTMDEEIKVNGVWRRCDGSDCRAAAKMTGEPGQQEGGEGGSC